MDFINDLQERATDLAQSVVATSKRLAEIAKLKASNMAEEDTIRKAYVELGKLYYAEHGTTPDGAYAAACEKITAARAAIETNNDRIAELKATAEAEGEIIDVTPPLRSLKTRSPRLTSSPRSPLPTRNSPRNNP